LRSTRLLLLLPLQPAGDEFVAVQPLVGDGGDARRLLAGDGRIAPGRRCRAARLKGPLRQLGDDLLDQNLLLQLQAELLKVGNSGATAAATTARVQIGRGIKVRGGAIVKALFLRGVAGASTEPTHCCCLSFLSLFLCVLMMRLFVIYVFIRTGEAAL
jgi:hypothetical protein